MATENTTNNELAMIENENTNNTNTQQGDTMIESEAIEATPAATENNTPAPAINDNEYAAMVRVVENSSSIDELAQNLHNAEIMPIDCKVAYSVVETGKHNAASRALAAITTKLTSLFESSGKAAGVSTIYNVLDARTVRKVRFSRKLAYNLQGSKALAQFMALAALVNRSESVRMATSVNGNVYSQNRNTYTVNRLDQKGNIKAIRKPQYNEAIVAIRKGNASSITSKPRNKASVVNEAVKVIANLVTVNENIAQPIEA